MRRILFLTPRNPYSGRYSGDVIRARKFIEKLKKKYSLTIVSLDSKDSKKKLGKINIWVNSKIYNIIETTHQTILLSIIDYIASIKMQK